MWHGDCWGQGTEGGVCVSPRPWGLSPLPPSSLAATRRRTSARSSTASATRPRCSPAPWPSRRSRSSSASVRWASHECHTRVCACPCVTPLDDRVSPFVPDQALLQVAKNLFTHLGRCKGWNPQGMVAPGSPGRVGGCPLCCQTWGVMAGAACTLALLHACVCTSCMSTEGCVRL